MDKGDFYLKAVNLAVTTLLPHSLLFFDRHRYLHASTIALLLLDQKGLSKLLKLRCVTNHNQWEKNEQQVKRSQITLLPSET
jgi:hypothetical protein